MKHKDLRPWLRVIAGGESLVSYAGATLLIETGRRSGLARQHSVPTVVPHLGHHR